MNFTRIWAMVHRHFYIWRRSIDQMISTFFWSTIDVFIWGFTAVYLNKININPDFKSLITILLSALIFWLIINRAQYEIGIAIMEEIWNQNLVNIFSTPLKLSEWVASTILIGFIKIFISIGLAILMAVFLYAANIFSLGFYLIPFAINLIIMGWFIGFITTGLIFRFGASIQAIVWAGIYILMPFSAVYYPVSALPPLAQKIAFILPSSYVFEGMREIIFRNSLDMKKLLIASSLNFIYLILSLAFLYWMFTISKNKGLARLE